MKPRNVLLSAVLLLLVNFRAPVFAAPSLIPAAPNLAASGYILMDAQSGRVLVEHNADERLPPASLTKMMTGYVLAHEWAQGNVGRDDQVKISHNAWAQNPVFAGSSLMWIEVNKTVPIMDLYRGLVISSGNDASVAIAEHVAGGEDAFADVMNQHAEILDLQNTNFVNSHGLPHPDHYTSARDLALLARAIIQDHPEEYEVYRERDYTYNGITQSNRNELLGDDGVDGLKTGHTEEAGYCLVTSARRNDMRLISVVMGTKSKRARVAETRKLLTYGFRFYETVKLWGEDAVTHQVRVWEGQDKQLELGPGKDIYVTIPRGKVKSLQDMTMVDQVIKAPISPGSEYGSLVMKLGEDTVVEEPLVALHGVEQSGFFARLWDKLVLFFTQLFSF
jgi:D-alanyl-D-alanine carboxypeptidase (penicillin-binding protein 5/6)